MFTGKTADLLNEIDDPREQLFVMEYMVNGFNAYKAAIAAGYAEATARNVASSWIKNSKDDSQKPHLWKVFNAERTKRLTHLDVTHDRIMQEYARIAFFDPSTMYDENGDLLEIKDMPEDTRRVIAGIDIHDTVFLKRILKVKLNEKIRALDSLARVTGMNQDNVNVVHRFGELLEEIEDETENDSMVQHEVEEERDGFT